MAEIDISAAPEWVAKLGPGLRKATIAGLRSAALRGVQVIVGQIVPSRSPVPFDRGLYRAGWRAPKLEDGAAIENLEPHAAFVESGVRAGNVKVGRAMIAALAAWAARKGLVRGDATGKSAAFAIATSMKRRGIFRQKGFGILMELVEEHLPKLVDEEVRRAIEKELK